MLAALAALLCVLSVAPAAAQAEQTRVLVRSFGGSSSELPNVADPYPLSNPQGIGVDESTGEVYVADTGNDRVEKFSATGEFLLVFGDDVNANPLAADRDVCTVLETCEAGTPGSTPGAFRTPEYVAVDNDASSPSFGDVYVADTADNVVSKFNSEGKLQESWGTEGQLNGSTTKATTLGGIAGIAVSDTGTLYVLGIFPNEAGNPVGALNEFEPDAKLASEVPLTGESQDISPGGVAVSKTGNIFRPGEGGTIFETAPTGALIGSATRYPISEQAFTLGPEGDLYIADRAGTLDRDEFNGAGEVIEQSASPCSVTPVSECGLTESVAVGYVGSGVGVAPDGEPILSNGEKGIEEEYGPVVTVPNVKTEAATDVAPRSATLTGSVNPEKLALTECEFEYVEAEKYQASALNPYAEGHVAECEPKASAIGLVNAEVKVQAELAGLIPGVTYHFRLVAANANDEHAPRVGADETFATFPPPSIGAERDSNLTASSAVLNAEINPEHTTTHYYFEYDTRSYAKGEVGHGVRVPLSEGEDPSIPAGGNSVPRSVSISDLEASTHTYYWRVVATNESGTTTSLEHTFRYEIANAGLPDGRAYELVTPSHKDGSAVGDVSILDGNPEIASDGARIIAKAIQCFGESPSCYAERSNSIGSPFEFTRTSSGWVTTPLSAPATEFSGSTSWAYDPDAGTALFSIPTPPSGEDEFYLREPGTGNFTRIGPDTPPEDGAQGPEGGPIGGRAQAFTPNFSHYAWEADYLWTSPFEGGQEVFEYAGVAEAKPLLVGVSGGEDSTSLISSCGTYLGGSVFGSAEGVRGSMSADGQTVFFTASECGSGAGENVGKEVPASTVYARIDGESPEAHTVAVSEPSPSACGAGSGRAEVACREAPPAGATFAGAAEDGSNAFFTSPQQLTDSATEDADPSDRGPECHAATGPNGCNLYEYEGVTAQHASERRLVDLSEGEGGAPVPGGPRVQGVLALSPNPAGERVYFVAKGVLTAEERPGCMAEWEAAGRSDEAPCQAVEGEDNLYVYSDGTHRVSFVTIMAAEEKGDEYEWADKPASRANVTPDGQFLVFLSSGQSTADDTDVSGAAQIFRYDSQTGQLVRLSAGYRGFNDDGNRTKSVCRSNECTENAEIVFSYQTRRTDPTMADDGSRVFFTSPVALTAHALNDALIGTLPGGEPAYARNVYEWESEGAGSCPAERSLGCVFLISDGRDVSVDDATASECLLGASAVCLLGSDATGDNVFFTTADQLVESDTNSEVDFYDARVCEPERGNPCIQSPPPPLPPCAGEECHGVPAAVPGVPSAPSETFNGAGNVAPAAPTVTKPTTTVLTRAQKLTKAMKACKAMKVRHKRLVCEAAARKRYGPVHKAKKSSNNVRPSSKRRAQ